MVLISVIIPIFNAAETLPATLASIKAQTLTAWEAILVDDGSSDSSIALAERWAKDDPRIQLVSNPGKGPSAARNYGALAHAQGEIIAFCDADDIWAPGKLTALAEAFLDDRHDAVFGQVSFFDGTPEHVGSRSSVPSGLVSIRDLMGENPVCTLSNLSLRRDIFAYLNGFDETMVHNEDLEFLIRLIGEGYRLKGLDQTHVLYRRSALGLSSNLSAMRAGRMQALRSAARYGFPPCRRSEAIHLRYLARRALRMDAPPHVVRALVREGMAQSPRAFLFPARRGVMIALAAALMGVLPSALRRRFFQS